MDNRTIVFTQPGEIAVVRSPIPTVGAGQVLLRTHKTMISQGTELTVLSQRGVTKDSVWGREFLFPYQPGYANVAEVVALGEGVESKWLGQMVFSDAGHTLYHTKTVEELTCMPSDITQEQMLLSVFATIALCGVRRSRLCLGEAVTVVGMGIIGQLVAQLSLISGALPVVCVERLPNRMERLPAAGRFILANSLEQAQEQLKGLTGGRGCDVVFEATGEAKLIGSEMQLLHPFGRMVIVSSPRGTTCFDFHDFCNRQSYEIIGAHNLLHTPVATYENPWTAKRDTELYLDLLRAKRLNVDSYVSQNVSYMEAPAVYQELLHGLEKPLGVVFTWNDTDAKS